MPDVPRNLVDLQTLLADNVAGDIGAQDVRDFLVSVYPEWEDFTPTWDAVTTSPVVGNAVVVARFVRIGPLVHAYYHYDFGSTTTFGSGAYTWTLPVDVAADVPTSIQFPIGSGMMVDAGAIIYSDVLAEVVTASTMRLRQESIAVAHNSPRIWAENDTFGWTITYEVEPLA